MDMPNLFIFILCRTASGACNVISEDEYYSRIITAPRNPVSRYHSAQQSVQVMQLLTTLTKLKPEL